MTEVCDGFLYHPDQNDALAQVKRLISGEFSSAWDNMFDTTIREAEDAVDNAKRRKTNIEKQLRLIKAELIELEAHEQSVKDAAERFDDTGVIEDILVPNCDLLLAAEQAKFANENADHEAADIDNAMQSLTKELEDGWQVESSSADDEFVYITVKQPRTTVPPTRPSRDSLVERVRAAFETHRLDYLNRAKPEFRALQNARPRGP